MKKYLPLLIITMLSVAAWFSGVHQYFSISVLREHHQTLQVFVAEHHLQALLLYGVIYVLIVSLSIPGAAFMSITGGLLFGQLYGTGTVVIAATLGSTLFFISARMASEALLWRRAGPWFSKMQEGFKANVFSYLLTLRLIPLFPFVAVNLVAAILQLPLRTFFICTLFGIIPGTFVYVSLGVGLRDIINAPELTFQAALSPKIIFALVGLGVLTLLPALYTLFQRRRET